MQRKEFQATSGIQIEPHESFKEAIIGVNKKGEYIYEHSTLVAVCMNLHGLDIDEASEWVDYNIVGLAINGFEVR